MATDLLTTGQVAELLGVSRQHVVDLCERGRLPFIRVGQHRRLHRSDVEPLVTRPMSRDQERSLWLHRVVAGRIATTPETALAKAKANLDVQRRAHRGTAAMYWIERWTELVAGPLDRLADVLTAVTDDAVELRQNSPFAGVLTEADRQAALAAFRAHWLREHVA